MKARIFAIVGIAAGAFVAGPAAAQDICNTVINGFDVTAVNATGNAILHSGSAPCPQTAAAPGEPAPEPETITIAGDVAFDFDRATIRPEFLPTLDEIAAALNENPDTRLQVVGHTDRESGQRPTTSPVGGGPRASPPPTIGAAGRRGDRWSSAESVGAPVAPNTSEEGRAATGRSRSPPVGPSGR